MTKLLTAGKCSSYSQWIRHWGRKKSFKKWSLRHRKKAAQLQLSFYSNWCFMESGKEKKTLSSFQQLASDGITLLTED